jgi:hypothetical protein
MDIRMRRYDPIGLDITLLSVEEEKEEKKWR